MPNMIFCCSCFENEFISLPQCFYTVFRFPDLLRLWFSQQCRGRVDQVQHQHADLHNKGRVHGHFEESISTQHANRHRRRWGRFLRKREVHWSTLFLFCQITANLRDWKGDFHAPFQSECWVITLFQPHILMTVKMLCLFFRWTLLIMWHQINQRQGTHINQNIKCIKTLCWFLNPQFLKATFFLLFCYITHFTLHFTFWVQL